MPETNNLDNDFWMRVGIIAVPLLLGLLVGLCMSIYDFAKELKYINYEIRCTSGAERKHWIRQRRRLWLSLIPFVKY